MKVMVIFVGPLVPLGSPSDVEFELPDGAAFRDLLEAVSRRFGDRMPSEIWDSDRGGFKGGILAVGEGRDLESPDTRLKNNEEIKLVPLLIGG